MGFLSLTTALAVSGFLLIAWNATRGRKDPRFALAGLTLLLAAIIVRAVTGVTGSVGIAATAQMMFADVGIGMIAAAILFLIKKAAALPFMLLGLLALLVAALLHIIGRLFGFDDPAMQPRALLLELGPDDQIVEVEATLDRYALTYERAFPKLTFEMDEDLAQTYLVYGEEAALSAALEDLRSDTENVDDVAFNAIVELEPVHAEEVVGLNLGANARANDPMIAQQWGLDAIRAHEAHQLLSGLSVPERARVAILDTGVDGKHADLKGVFTDSPGKTDIHGHGTHCAGIAGAATNNRRGVASLNWDGQFVEVVGYKALGDKGMGTLETIAQSIIDATRDGADVISMSLGSYGPQPPRVVVNAIEFAQKRNVIVVVSAGNSNQDAALHMPSNVPGVLAIAAVDQGLDKARFSNTVGTLQFPLAAPGVDILSLKPNGAYVKLSGTSMATPMVSGLIGVMRALSPDLSRDEAYRLLHETGTDLADTERVGRLINAEAAIRAVTGQDANLAAAEKE